MPVTPVTPEFCPRTISFTIPGNPGVQVTAVENAGKIDFTVDVLNGTAITADLRGLFFHFNQGKLGALTITDTDGLITGTQIGANKVINLGEGANLNGAASPFDVGIKFGTAGIGSKGDDINFPVHFTLSNTGNDLVLDDFAHLQFGARLDSIGGPGGPRGGVSKIVGIAPEAPQAQDESFTMFEDGASGLTVPSKLPVGVTLDVLANDTDSDGDTLSVIEIHDGPAHGSVAIASDGHSVIYTPDLDYSGPDSFEYCVSDGHGGQDHATAYLSIAAVADLPTLTYEIYAGSTVNEILLDVTATQYDADSSEFLDRIDLGILPAGVTVTPFGGVNPGGQPDQVVQQFLLTLPLAQDWDFDFGVTAASKEVTNGDEETNGVLIPIVYEYNTTSTPLQFTAEDQSIWSTGDQFKFVDDRFVGVDTGHFNESVGSELYAGISGHIQLGFQSTLTFEGGEIDATSNYDVTVETNYNKTTDQLLIDTGSVLTSASFSTEGPQGSYVLDFVYDVLLNAYAGVNIDFGSIDFDPLGVLPGDQTLDLGGIDERINLPAIAVGPGNYNVLDLNSDTLGGTIEFPAPLDAFSVNYAWPNVTTNGTYPPNPVVADGASNNFLELVLDVDTLVTQLVGIPNVFDPPRISLGPIFADFDLLDVDVIGGLNFLQKFGMTLGDLTGMLWFEDGTNQSFAIGDSLLISNASDIDFDGDRDGSVEFQFIVVPTATLHNETDLGFNIGAEINLFTLQLGYDIEIYNPFGDNVHYSDSTTLGPLADIGESVPVVGINVFDDTFAINFGPRLLDGNA